MGKYILFRSRIDPTPVPLGVGLRVAPDCLAEGGGGEGVRTEKPLDSSTPSSDQWLSIIVKTIFDAFIDLKVCTNIHEKV